MDFDIERYNIAELMEIFDLNEITSVSQIDNQIDSYRNKLFMDNCLGNDKKMKITQFLNGSRNKLTKNLKQNTLLKNSPNDHPIIENVNTIDGENAKPADGRTSGSDSFPAGKLNPINTRTIKRILSVDTRFRDPYYNTKSSDFMINLPVSFKKVVKMSISSIQIPLSVYSISKSMGTTHFSIDSTNITIEEGNYSNFKTNADNNDCPFIKHEINPLTTAVNVDFQIDKSSQKSVFTNNTAGPITIYFNRDVDGNSDLQIPLPLKLGWLLGFRAGEYTLKPGESVSSEGICSITGPRYIYVCINDYNYAGNNYYIGAFTESVISPDIIARLNYQGLLQDATIYKYSEYSDEVKVRTRDYFGPVNIQKLHIQVLDEYGRLVDFNNMDWSFILEMEILYD